MVGPHVVAAGDTTEVEVKAFHNGLVSIRWGDPSGPEVGRAMFPTDVKASVLVPDVAPGGYYLYATQPDSPNPAVSIEVVGDSSDAALADDSSTSARQQVAEADATQASAPAPPPLGGVGVAQAPTSATAARTATVAPRARATSSAITPPAAAATTDAATTGAAGAAAPSGDPSVAAPPVAGGPVAPVPWSDDIAGGFTSGRIASKSAGFSAASDGATSGLPGTAKAGMALVTIGITALAVGLFLALQRRRTAAAGSGSSAAIDSKELTR